MADDDAVPSGPFPRFTLIFCTLGEHANARVAAFADGREAAEHARLRLQRLPERWCSVVVAAGADRELVFVGCWDRGPDGGLTWEDASVA